MNINTSMHTWYSFFPANITWSGYYVFCLHWSNKYWLLIVGVECVLEPLLRGLQDKYQRQQIRRYVDLWGEVPNNHISPCDSVKNERFNHGRVQLAHASVLLTLLPIPRIMVITSGAWPPLGVCHITYGGHGAMFLSCLWILLPVVVRFWSAYTKLCLLHPVKCVIWISHCNIPDTCIYM